MFTNGMAGERKYPDLRYLFMRGLIDHERDQRRHHYMKSAAECTSRAIVSLELADEPIKSVKQARMLEGIGGETCSKLTKIGKEKEYSCLKPLAGRFVSSAGGILVALLDATEEMLYNSKSADKIILVPEDGVKRRAVRLTEEQFADGPNEFCKAWWRLEVLIKRGYIRRRSQKKAPVLQLLPIGKDIAARLRGGAGLTSTVPRPSCTIPTLPTAPPVMTAVSGERTVSSTITLSDLTPFGGETSARLPELEDALYTNDRGLDGVVMLVDRREMGGERVGLGELCGLLGDNGICYKTQHLKAGDYSWVWRVNGEEIVLPCLVERKRADDIARTLKEGRFWSQVNKMKGWKEEFTGRGIQCGLHYILEGQPEQYVVKCDDGCQGIIKCGNPTLPQVKLVIEDLKRHPDLLVKETGNLNITVILLTSLTAELNERAKKGDFANLLQSALTDKKPALDNTVTGVASSGTADDVSMVHHFRQDIKNEPVSVDLSFDEELRIAIERSKMEMSKAYNVLNSMPDKGGKLCKGSVKSEAQTDAVVVLEEDEDAELAAVLERSKYETHGRIDDLADTEPKPLMQYHCTEGGSLHYPSANGKTKDYNANTYRPKINRKQTPSNPIAKDYLDVGFRSDGMSCKPLNDSTLNNFKSLKVENVNRTCSEMITGVNFMDTDSKVTPDIYSSNRIANQDMFHLTEDQTPPKRKYSKKDFIFSPEENNVEETYSSCSDCESLSRKKLKSMHFCLTPSKDLVECNVLQVTGSRKSSTEDRSQMRKIPTDTPVSKLGKVYKMRMARYDILEPVKVQQSEKVKGNTEDEKRSTNDIENIETRGYNSEDDLFGDASVTNADESEQFEIKAEPLGLSSHVGKGIGCCVEKYEKGGFNNDYNDKFERRIEASGVNTSEVDINSSVHVKTEDVDRDSFMSLSQSSEGGDSLPDIGLDIMAEKNISERNPTVADGFDSSKNKFDLVTNGDRSQVCLDVGCRQRRFDSGYDSDTRSGAHDNETEEKVTLVISVLPHVDILLAREMLKKCNNNVDMCVAELLEREVTV